MRHPHLCLAFLPTIFSLVTAGLAVAQVPLPDAVPRFDGATRSQSVAVSVDPINMIAVSGNVTLTIETASPGLPPDSDSDATTTYAVTVNGSNKKVTGVLDAAYGAGIRLDVLLVAPSGATPFQRTLGTSAMDLVTGVGHVAETGLTISYTAGATETAAPNGAGVSRTITLTLSDL